MFSADDAQKRKIRGSARDILWINEGNELFFEGLPTIGNEEPERKNIYIDFNPSDPSTLFLYDLAERDDANIYL